MDQTLFVEGLRSRGIVPCVYDIANLRSQGGPAAEMLTGLEEFGTMILVGIRNPDPRTKGPMIWVVLVPTDPAVEPLVHRVQSGVPAAEIVAERSEQLRMVYDVLSKPKRRTFEQIDQTLADRLSGGYTTENLLFNETLLMRIVFELQHQLQ